MDRVRAQRGGGGLAMSVALVAAVGCSPSRGGGGGAGAGGSVAGIGGGVVGTGGAVASTGGAGGAVASTGGAGGAVANTGGAGGAVANTGGTGGVGAGGVAGTAGPFRAMGTYPAGPQVLAIAAGDLTGDGRPDLAVTNYGACAPAGTGGAGVVGVSVLINRGDGTFATAVRYAAGANPFAVAIGDLDGDGKNDLAVANRGTYCAPESLGDVVVLRNQGTGTFPAATHLAPGARPSAVTIADLDGDGRNDLAVTNFGSGSEQTELLDGGVTVLVATGGGGFAAPRKFPSAGIAPTGIAAADLNGDGRIDLAIANYGYSGIGDAEHSRSVGILLNDGRAGFDAGTQLTALPGPSYISPGDVDGDGDIDLLVMNYSGINLMRGDGRGGFLIPTANFSTVVGGVSSAARDLDGDGKLDVALAGWGGAFMLRGIGDGTFAAAVRLNLTGNPTGVADADFDGDGNPDLAVATADDVTILLNRP